MDSQHQLSELSKRKFKTVFRHFDYNGNGCLEREDFELIANRVCEGEPPESGRAKTMGDKCTELFDMCYAMGGKDGKVTEEEWLAACAKLSADPDFKNFVEVAAKTCFDLLDTDGDGFIHEGEYIKFVYSIGIHDYENLAKIGFKGLDINNDGVISLEEFRNAYFEFWFSETENCPGTTIFGPLLY